jgi:ribonucleoside-diphosphate reductase alpha chain
MPITKIRKRDGSVVDFNRDKIRIAMEKAARATNPVIDIRPFDVISDHAVRHVEIKFQDSLPSVEDVQDLVELTLMEYGLFDIAKHYILYRAERSKMRTDEVKKEVADKNDHSKVSYITETGEKKPLDRRKLKSLFNQAVKVTGTEKDIDIDLLVHQTEGNLYEGMTNAELGKAMTMAARSYIEREPAYSKVAAYIVLHHLYLEAFGPEGDKAYSKGFVANLKSAVDAGRIDKRLLEFDLEELASYIKPERDLLFEYMGAQTLYDRYFIREEGGSRKLEAPQTFWMRIAMGLSIAESENRTEWAKKFYDILSELRYTPSTPTLFHAGTSYPQLSSCYLNYVSDDLSNIFKVYGDNAQLSKYSGGIGTSWSAVRATGSVVKSTNLESQGVVPFLRIANDVNIAINRSGKRRGAACVYLETWHYEIEDFLDLRKNTGDERRRTHDINTANWVPDLFMKRVIEGKKWTLFSPDETPELHNIYGSEFEKKYLEYEKKAHKGEMRIWKEIEAKDLWRKMISMLFETGHPWITFKDACNVRSPQDHVGVIHNSNLCTEITLNNSIDETAVCNIGSINLSNHVENGKMLLPKLKETVQMAIRMLDNTIDPNFYPTVETRNANIRHRPIGLGLMGFQDVLYKLDIDFDSPEAVTFADENMEFISYWTIHTSAMLAKEKGAYESFKGSKWDRGIFPIDTLDLLEKERGMPIGVARTSKMDWKPVREAVKRYGMRNSNTMAIAPTATISNINGCFPCIEPIYKNLYVKSNMSGEFTIVNEYLIQDLKKLGLWNETMLESLKASDGSVQDITSIPPRLRNKYKSVFEVGINWLVKIAAYRGKWIDQAQSFNIFFHGTSGKALSDVYMHAWHLGLKTTYYLRSLGATSVEKSTLDINKWKTPGTLPLEPVVSAAPMPAFAGTTVASMAAAPSLAMDVSMSALSMGNTFTAAPEEIEESQSITAPEMVAEESTPEPASNPYAMNMESIMGDDLPMKACLVDDPDCESCQ